MDYLQRKRFLRPFPQAGESPYLQEFVELLLPRFRVVSVESKVVTRQLLGEVTHAWANPRFVTVTKPSKTGFFLGVGLLRVGPGRGVLCGTVLPFPHGSYGARVPLFWWRDLFAGGREQVPPPQKATLFNGRTRSSGGTAGPSTLESPPGCDQRFRPPWANN